MTKQIEVAKKIVFQLEKILLEANSGSASCFGNAVYDAEKGARSGEVWHLISYLNGIIGDCLVRSYGCFIRTCCCLCI